MAGIRLATAAILSAVPIENLQDFYKRHYQPDNVVLIVAGKFDENWL